METQYIERFHRGSVCFDGAWMFSETEGSTSFLLSRNGTSILLDKLLCDSILQKKMSDELSFKLIAHGIASTPSSLQFQQVDEVKPTFFIIDLTKNCNLHCVYCFRDYQQRGTSVNIEELNKICDYISCYCKKHSIKRFHIQPWGGEPLMELEKIYYIQDFFSARNQYPRISIETNATLITKEIAKVLYKRKISIGISIDGDISIHDMQRPYNTDKGSLLDVLQGIENLKNAGYKSFGTISVVTHRGIDSIESIIDFLVKEAHIYNLKFNIVRTDKDSDLSISIGKIDNFIERLFSKVISLSEAGYPITEGNIIERIYNLLVRRERNICKSRGCMGGRKMVSFDRKGRIFPCEMTDFEEESIGTICSKRDLIDIINSAVHSKEYFKEYKTNECNTCPWWYYCRGGCHTAIKYKEDSYVGIDNIECKINKKLYPLLIETIIKKPSLISKLTNSTIKICR